MSTFVVLATGESISQAVAESVRGRCGVVAVSDAYRLAPWADALVSHDPAWWDHHPKALSFRGRKFCGRAYFGLEAIRRDARFPGDCNSGLQGMRVAHLLGASRILLAGFDMRGTHFFGKHPSPLQNTTQARFAEHLRQIARWNLCPVVNCTPGSALNCFPASTLEHELMAPADQSSSPGAIAC